MKKNISKLIKLLISGVITFVVLTLFCSVYYNIPIHSTNINGATDYVWQTNKTYISMTEGIGYGKTNNEGLMNLYDYSEGMPIDVLIMGSSHLQGFSISLEDNCANILNKLLKTKNVYNISVTGHNFKTCVCNLDAALKRYKPKIVVLEITNITISEDDINKILNNEIEENGSISNDLINFIQKNPFIRQLYNQIESFKSSKIADNTTFENNKDINIELTNKLLEHINNVCSECNTKAIILYHPTVKIDNNGMEVNSNREISKSFEKLCLNNNLFYVDMTNKYFQEYENNKYVPTGFNNTSLGKGHINSHGHQMIAEELYELIKEIY